MHALVHVRSLASWRHLMMIGDTHSEMWLFKVGNYVASYLPNYLLVNLTNTLANLPGSGLPMFK